MIDPSDGYLNALMATQQRPGAEAELKAMRQGLAPDAFRVLGKAVYWLKNQSQLGLVSLLDAGCASAYYHEVIEFYTPGWVEYTGIDFNTEAIHMAKALYPDRPLFVANIMQMGFVNQQFDAVLSAATINHIKKWRLALAELTQVCRHWLILHRLPVHEEETMVSTAEAYGETVWDIVFNSQELAFTLAKKGFSRIWLEEWGGLTTQVWERQSRP